MFTAKTLPVAADDHDIEAPTPIEGAQQQQQLREPSTDGVAAGEIPSMLGFGLTLIGLRGCVQYNYSSPKLWPPAIGFAFYILGNAGNTAGFAVVLHAIIGSWAIGIAVAGLAFASILIGYWMNKAYIGSPVFHELLRSPKARNEMEQTFRKFAIGTIVPNLVWYPLMIVYVMAPYLSAGDAFGLGPAATRPLAWAMIVCMLLNAFIIWPFTQPFVQMVPVEMAKFMNTMIENYMGKVRACLADFAQSTFPD